MEKKSTLKTLRFSNNGLSVAGNTVLYMFKKTKTTTCTMSILCGVFCKSLNIKSFMLNFL